MKRFAKDPLIYALGFLAVVLSVGITGAAESVSRFFLGSDAEPRFSGIYAYVGEPDEAILGSSDCPPCNQFCITLRDMDEGNRKAGGIGWKYGTTERRKDGSFNDIVIKEAPEGEWTPYFVQVKDGIQGKKIEGFKNKEDITAILNLYPSGTKELKNGKWIGKLEGGSSKISKGRVGDSYEVAQCGVQYYSAPATCGVTTYTYSAPIAVDCSGGGMQALGAYRYVPPAYTPNPNRIVRIPGPYRNVDYVPQGMTTRDQLIRHLSTGGHGYSVAYLQSLSTQDLRDLHDNEHNSGAVTASGIRIRQSAPPYYAAAPAYRAPVTYYSAPPVYAAPAPTIRTYSSGAGVNVFGARLGTYSYGSSRYCPNGMCPN